MKTRTERAILKGSARDTAQARRLVTWLLQRDWPMNRDERDLLIALEATILLEESEWLDA